MRYWSSDAPWDLGFNYVSFGLLEHRCVLIHRELCHDRISCGIRANLNQQRYAP